jgi:sulfate adenylyltransferase
MTKFLEVGGLPVTLLDGDLVRKHLSSELGFSKETSRFAALDMLLRRLQRTAALRFAPPSHHMTRPVNSQMIEPYGGFILVHIATTVEVCEQRDRKGLYAKARAGILKEFTGISDPNEVPADADVTINIGELSAEEAAQEIILHLEREGSSEQVGRESRKARDRLCH